MTLGQYLRDIFTDDQLRTAFVSLANDDERNDAWSFVYGPNHGPNELGGEKIVTFGIPFASETSFAFDGPSLNIRLDCEENDYLVEYPLTFT